MDRFCAEILKSTQFESSSRTTKNARRFRFFKYLHHKYGFFFNQTFLLSQKNSYSKVSKTNEFYY